MEAKFKDLDKIILSHMDKDEETTSNLFAEKLKNKNTKVTKFYDNKGNCNNLMIELVDKKPPLHIIENGDYDVSEYTKAKVEVPAGYQPEGDMVIAQNGIYSTIRPDNEHFSPTVNIMVEGGDVDRYLDMNLELSNDDNIHSIIKELPSISFNPITTNCNNMFSYLQRVESIPCEDFDTHNVTCMDKMFEECQCLTSLDLSNWDVSNVQSTRYMFHNCTSLSSLNLNNLDFSSLTDAQDMFAGCFDLENINTQCFNNSPLVLINNMFLACQRVESLDLSGWDFDNVYLLNGSFLECSNLSEITLPTDGNGYVNLPSTYEGLSDMFNGCESLPSQVIFKLNAPHISSTAWMYAGCTSLTNIDLTEWNVPTVWEIYGMFSNCTNLEEINMSTWTNSLGMDSAFAECSSLRKLDIRRLTINETGLISTFDNVPDDCLIIVKDQYTKDYILEYYPNLTNIQIAGDEPYVELSQEDIDDLNDILGGEDNIESDLTEEEAMDILEAIINGNE